MYIVSACLTGENCKYDGGNNYNDAVYQFTKEHNCIMICPEMEGGLSCPRPPAEQIRCSSAETASTQRSDCNCAETAHTKKSNHSNAVVKKTEHYVRVMNKEGQDVTEEFLRGAKISLSKAEEKAAELGEPIEGAILRANSPTCGSGTIYDGSFSGTLTEGDGIFAGMLKKRGIPVETAVADVL